MKKKITRSVQIQGLDGLSKRLRANARIKVSKIFRDETVRAQIGEIVVADIKLNADFGSPAPSTEKWRRLYDRINPTDEAYSSGKINAVFTGELLEDLKNNVLANPPEFSYEIGHSSGTHKKYRGKTKLIGSKTPYRVISDYLINELEYNYMVLSPGGKRKIAELIIREIEKLLR